MSSMKFIGVPACNKTLITQAITKNTRIDGRTRDDYRHLELVFGKNYGSCLASLGNTRCLATVSGEIAEPSSSRPSEGMLRVNVDLSPMASPNIDMNSRMQEETVEIVRLLERAVRDAKCIDMESLCLVAGKKAWQIEVNLLIWNTEGNLIECASVALIAALAHFRRNDVTVTEDRVTIHSFAEKHSIPLTILHYPFCTKFCFFDSKKSFIVDPSEMEETVCEGYLVVAANVYRELTALHISGKSMIDKNNILKCCQMAIDRTKRLTDFLKKKLAEDAKMRAEVNFEAFGFSAHLKMGGQAICGAKQSVEIIEPEEEEDEDEEWNEEEICEGTKAFRFASADEEPDSRVGEGGPSTWGVDFEMGDKDSEDEEVGEVYDDVPDTRQTKKSKPDIVFSKADVTKLKVGGRSSQKPRKK